MTFEEFFKKKRIDLPALEKADGALFSEFKIHFEDMGEKSFDHTKKYWFNKLRRQYPAPAEIKEPKPHIANPIAEQTITESLGESVSPRVVKQGFVPRFKADISKPTAPENTDPDAPTEPVATATATVTSPPPPAAKPGFTPRFKAANMPKPAPNPNKDTDASA